MGWTGQRRVLRRGSGRAHARSGPCLAPRLEVFAPIAVAHVELVPDDGKEHWVRAEEELAVLDGVKAELQGQVRRAPAVPAGAMADFRLERNRYAHELTAPPSID